MKQVNIHWVKVGGALIVVLGWVETKYVSCLRMKNSVSYWQCIKNSHVKLNKESSFLK